ncbi:hypothetical protein TEA_021050 [Camellia sinensis var. sinensis]|uniref:Damage-control phosphatase ARMT1-like metal-binding domain-containing protein n=1 Tax=Camellia sinensis var. sinensis TaxID=542762 RepID=A0A4S4E701_CAMSN|nr:hypothetical protein TEA_021050 [Camellia sinensis var. sinensis]
MVSYEYRVLTGCEYVYWYGGMRTRYDFGYIAICKRVTTTWNAATRPSVVVMMPPTPSSVKAAAGKPNAPNAGAKMVCFPESFSYMGFTDVNTVKIGEPLDGPIMKGAEEPQPTVLLFETVRGSPGQYGSDSLGGYSIHMNSPNLIQAHDCPSTCDKITFGESIKFEFWWHIMFVVLAANELPSINDVTYPELIEILSKLKDEHGQLMGVDTSNLLIANSGNDLPVIDLARISQELAFLASDADLVILVGMGRGIETNLYAQFKCDSLKIGMVKHPEVAQFLGGRLYDCVFKYNEVLS